MRLTEFLLARITKDEAHAQALNVAYYAADSELWAPAVLVNARALLMPDRVLAECEAKRRLVDLHQPSAEYPWCAGCGQYTDEHGEGGQCRTLRILALPYADHPDYDESWRP